MEPRIVARENFEPIGIVIAGPARTEVVPRVAAYVWGPAPELLREVMKAGPTLAEPRAA